LQLLFAPSLPFDPFDPLAPSLPRGISKVKCRVEPITETPTVAGSPGFPVVTPSTVAEAMPPPA
jgi:hypothetical protein